MNRYNKGRRKEYKIMKDERALNREVIRSAGSHGFADVISIDIEAHEIRFIQSKKDDLSTAEKERLTLDNMRFNGIFRCCFEVR